MHGNNAVQVNGMCYTLSLLRTFCMGTARREKRRKLTYVYLDNTVNGRTADIAITSHGSDFYFAICALMTVSAFAFIGMSFMRPRRERLFHYLTAGVVFVAAIACKFFTFSINMRKVRRFYEKQQDYESTRHLIGLMVIH